MYSIGGKMSKKINVGQLGGYTNVGNRNNTFTYMTSKDTLEDIEKLGFLDTAFEVLQVGDLLRIFIEGVDHKVDKIIEYVIVDKDTLHKKLYKKKINVWSTTSYAVDNKE
jgi:hypothetical protein